MAIVTKIQEINKGRKVRDGPPSEEEITSARREGLVGVLRQIADEIESGDVDGRAHFEHGEMIGDFGARYLTGGCTILLHLQDPKPRWIAEKVRDRGAEYVLEVANRGKKVG